MASIDFVTVEVAETAAAEGFYTAAFSVGDRVRVRAGETPTAGFRGFTLSLVVPQPGDVDSLVRRAIEAGATSLSSPKKSLWGYGGVVQAPDGTIWTVASSSKKETGPVTERVEDIVLQLGVADVNASKRFYIDRGFTVDKSYGRKYVEFDTGPVRLTLNKRAALAKVAGVPADGSGSPRLTIGSDAGQFTDPDGFEWAAVAT